MPSIGHVVVGLAAGKLHAGAERPRLGPTLYFTALATFPDADVLARTLGAQAGSPWLHRGALHSLLAAAVVALGSALLLDGLGRSVSRLAATALVVAASHGALDAFTGGGGGVMFLWPWSTERFLAPWHLVPAAPMGAHLLSIRGAAVMLRELALLSPLVLYAVWPSRSEPTPWPPLPHRGSEPSKSLLPLPHRGRGLG
ncbi:MAG TPA: metal-dependent hydrolase [Anaeromyxobacteraceae bacterium]|nr:metal-dependent hydrolase [Anaeromyxobacteraceae bacterium]